MKLVPTPDNELEVYEGNNKVGFVENGALYALTDFNNITQSHYVEDVGNRNEVIPALKQWFKEQQDD